jgi:hypothetical protein
VNTLASSRDPIPDPEDVEEVHVLQHGFVRSSVELPNQFAANSGSQNLAEFVNSDTEVRVGVVLLNLSFGYAGVLRGHPLGSTHSQCLGSHLHVARHALVANSRRLLHTADRFGLCLSHVVSSIFTGRVKKPEALIRRRRNPASYRRLFTRFKDDLCR